MKTLKENQKCITPGKAVTPLKIFEKFSGKRL